MIIAAALCPSPPLLIPGLTGVAQPLGDLRQACRAAVAELIAADPDVVAVVGAGDVTRTWPADERFDVTAFAPGLPGATSGASAGPPAGGALPASLGVGAWLLEQGGYAGDRLLWSVAPDEPPGRCAGIGAELAEGPGRMALLVLADGSACRDPKAPGYFDHRSAGFDAAVETAIRTGELTALHAIDPRLAGELMATGRPALQVLAGAFDGIRPVTRIRYCDDPLGVAYLAASLRVALPRS